MSVYLPSMPLPGPETPTLVPHHASTQLYVVHHAPSQAIVERPIVVVLAGPMSLERSHGYLSWVRWARTLALNGLHSYHFDYRGVGESTGVFAEQTFDSWSDDLAAVLALARASHPNHRVVVNGLRLGALLAYAARHSCDGVLLWDPPVSGKAMLMEMLRRKLAADYMEHVGERKNREAYVAELEAGGLVEVEGFVWSRDLWRSAERFVYSAVPEDGVAVRTVYLDGREGLPEHAPIESVHVGRPPFWLQSAHLVADLTELFDVSLKRLMGFS